MASQTIRALVEVNLMSSTFQRPQCGNASTTTAYDGNPFRVLHFEDQVSRVTEVMIDVIIEGLPNKVNQLD